MATTRGEAAREAYLKAYDISPVSPWRNISPKEWAAWEAGAEAAVEWVAPKTPGQIAYEANGGAHWAGAGDVARKAYEKMAKAVLEHARVQ